MSSFFTKIIPHALCCIVPPKEQDDETRPSTDHDLPPTVARKPVPYAMINVPDEKDFTDITDEAFRRMLTASPACPVEAGSITNAQLRATPKGEMKDTALAKGTVRTSQPLGTSSPVSVVTSRRSHHAKHRSSKTRLDKKISKERSHDSKLNEVNEELEPPVEDHRPRMQATMAESKGPCDVLAPLSSSIELSDSHTRIASDAQADNAATTAQSTRPIRVSKPKGQIFKLEGTVSDEEVPSVPIEASADRVSSASNPHTPQRLSFTQALQLYQDEVADVILERLSTGVVDGSIIPPIDSEMSLLRAFNHRGTSEDWKLLLPSQSSLNQEPDTPQTIVRRSAPVIGSTQGEPTEESKRTSLLTQIEPAVLEYLAKFSETQPPKSIIETDARELQSTPRDNIAAVESSKDRVQKPEVNLPHQCHVKTTSVTSLAPSENKSLHLFNMNIPARLQNKSNGTLFSPAISRNNSLRSLALTPPVPPMPQTSPIRNIPPFSLGRAEHNRKPSDPKTRQLFEQPGRRYHPCSNQATPSLRARCSREGDDASSVYSIPSRSNVSYVTKAPSVRKNVNSLAVGGRSASTEIPARRSSRSHSSTMQDPKRSLSITGGNDSGRLNAATEVISRYLDGKADDHTDVVQTEPLDSIDQLGHSSHYDAVATVADVKGKFVDKSDITSLSTDWATPASNNFWNEEVYTRGRKQSSNSRDITEFNSPGVKETATQMWDRIYREACGNGSGDDSLAETPHNDFHRSPSCNSPQIQHKSSSILKTPTSFLRRSQSADPVTRKAFEDKRALVDSATSSKLARTMKRLSFWQLKPQQQTAADGEAIQKPCTSSQAASISGLRGVHTPPLDHYLGLWGSFPSEGRAERSGPAGETDDVLTTDFGREYVYQNPVGEASTMTSPEFCSSSFPGVQKKPKKYLANKMSKLNSTKAKSMSPGTPPHRVEKSLASLPRRWQRQARTKSSEWRGYAAARGHRGSVSPGLPVKHPDLEILPGETLFSRTSLGDSKLSQVDGMSFGSENHPADDTGLSYTPSKMVNATTQTSGVKRQAASSLWESVTIDDTSDQGVRGKENVSVSGASSGEVNGLSEEVSSKASRASKDIKIPGSFE